MKTHAFAADTTEALLAQLATVSPDFVSAHVNAALGPLPGPEGVAWHGATSCLGAMTGGGVHDGAAAFVIEDPDGSYGTAALPYGDDPEAAASQAATLALRRADRIGESPDMVWISATPGVEEAVLSGLEHVFGPDVPIIGGSAADNDVSGQWFVFDGDVTTHGGLVVSVLFPSTPVSFAYQNGYSPTRNTGVVTAATGRTIHRIDDRPAMEVYTDWTGGAVSGAAPGQGPAAILSDSTLWPLGRPVNEIHGVPFHLLAHPATAQANGDIELFANVAEGETLTLMTGTVDSLIDRAGRVAALARKLRPGQDREIAGALMIYCGGCMLTVRPELDRVVSGVTEALGDVPFLGAFTFGEQGPLINSGNRHGNLMISCIIFEA